MLSPSNYNLAVDNLQFLLINLLFSIYNNSNKRNQKLANTLTIRLLLSYFKTNSTCLDSFSLKKEPEINIKYNNNKG